jgi:Holliday junction resolvase RusA-like endonuclease
MWEYEVILDTGILIDPKAKQRPRFNGRHAYTPASTRFYEKAIKAFLTNAYKGALIPKSIPVGVDLAFNVPQLKKPVRDMPTVGLDVDNAAKAILDAMNGIVFEDDSQVCDLNLKKRYASEGYIQIKVYLLNSVRKEVI